MVEGSTINYTMSGHSKWATIKRQKGAADIKRGLAFTKISNAITIAVRQGGGITDPESNFRLRLAVEAAKAVNMPKENIERAIQRAVGKGEGAVSEVIYEGFAPGGVAVVIEAATDNSQRTTAEIKSLFQKEGARFGQPGSTLYQFAARGKITVKKNNASLDEMLEMAAESGAEDIEEAGDGSFVLYTDPSQLTAVKDKLLAKGTQVLELELTRKPIVKVPVLDKMVREKVLNFLQKLEELDDVQKVYSNLG